MKKSIYWSIACGSLLFLSSLVAQQGNSRSPSAAEQTVMAEAQAATPLEFGVTLPPGASVTSFEFWAKNGPDIGSGWVKCSSTGQGRCGDVPAGYAVNETRSLPTDDGLTVQSKIVPNSGSVVRGRIKVYYTVNSKK